MNVNETLFGIGIIFVLTMAFILSKTFKEFICLSFAGLTSMSVAWVITHFIVKYW